MGWGGVKVVGAVDDRFLICWEGCKWSVPSVLRVGIIRIIIKNQFNL